MTLEEVYQYFGSGNQACKALGLTRQSFSIWTKRGYIPMLQQLRLEKLTHGELKADESHSYKNTEDKKEYWPNYRYYSKTHGMCQVDSIVFQEGMKAKITYRVKGAKLRKISTFNAKFLMQAIDKKDTNHKFVYEGDVLLCEDNNYFYFHDIKQMQDLLKLTNFIIIGHIYDGKDYTTNGTN
ncbi:MAG TPA: Cro/CI family transcriptional regulator [Flavitalea sp.]|nr:Cro/CI family transcriptional regulator [Flavitalea sp.]